MWQKMLQSGGDGVLPSIKLVPLVPPMISDVAPSGIASGSSYYTTSKGVKCDYFRAFDRDYSTEWHCNNTGDNQWLKYQFPSAVKANAFGIMPLWNSSGSIYANQCKDYEIYGSLDGTNYNTLLYSGTARNEEYKEKDIITFPNNTAFLGYGLRVKSVYSPHSLAGIRELQFYRSE